MIREIHAARRSFLKSMAGGAAVISLGGGNIAMPGADAIGLTGASATSGAAYMGGVPQASGSLGSGSRLSLMQVWRTLRGNGLPGWKLEQIKKSAKMSTRIDPDIAGMRSWSLAQKFRAQRARDVERMVGEQLDFPLIEHYRREFEREHGVWL